MVKTGDLVVSTERCCVRKKPWCYEPENVVRTYSAGTTFLVLALEDRRPRNRKSYIYYILTPNGDTGWVHHREVKQAS